MGETRHILVVVPPGYADSDARYPVIYMTDGLAHVWHTAGTEQYLSANGLMPQMIVLAGHSFGGTFAVHCLERQPELFNAYISVSPNLQWDGGVLVERARKAVKSDALKEKRCS